jgi:hypothetical protein
MRALYGGGKLSFAAERSSAAPQGQPDLRDGRAGGVLSELAVDGRLPEWPRLCQAASAAMLGVRTRPSGEPFAQAGNSDILQFELARHLRRR